MPFYQQKLLKFEVLGMALRNLLRSDSGPSALFGLKKGHTIKRYLTILCLVFLGGSGFLGGCVAEAPLGEVEAFLAVSLPTDSKSGIEPIQPIALDTAFDQRKVALGDRLFHDPTLSHDNTIACSSCHSLSQGGTDQAFRSIGINGAVGGINTPTVFNSGLNIRQFWDGRVRTLEEQIDGPTQHPAEMGSSWPEIIGKLHQDPSYPETFAAIYPEGITEHTIKNAIATFERSLLTRNSRFDQFLRGNQHAITPLEKTGYLFFKNYGCVACHQGASVGGNLFQRFGLFGNYFAQRGKRRNSKVQKGGHEGHSHLVKVPSLRVAVLTPPYFHDGSASTIQDAIKAMGKYQLRRNLTEEEVKAIVAFLHTLPGQYLGKDL